jgi:hypothetical protein
MKKGLKNKKPQSTFIIVLVAFFIMFVGNVEAQTSKELSLSVYPGFTLVNFEKALDYSDDYMNNWNEFHISAALRGFLLWDRPVQVGAEIAWQRLYYAYYVIPYGTSNVYREFNVSTTSITVLGRYWLGEKLFTVGGAGLHFFNDGVAPSICFEAGYMQNINDILKIPVSFHVSPIFGKGLPTLFSIGAGVSYTF